MKKILYLDRKLLRMFKNNFKYELIYFNNTGILNAILEKYLESISSMIINKNDIFKNFQRYSLRYKNTIKFTTIEVASLFKRIERIKNSDSNLEGLTFNKTINWMLYSILVNCGSIEIETKENIGSFYTEQENTELEEEKVYFE